MKATLMLAPFALAFTTAADGRDGEIRATSDEKKICRTEQVTGTRTRTQRICLTEREWRDLAANTKKALDDYSRHGSLNPDPTRQGQPPAAVTQ